MASFGRNVALCGNKIISRQVRSLHLYICYAELYMYPIFCLSHLKIQIRGVNTDFVMGDNINIFTKVEQTHLLLSSVLRRQALL